MKSQIAKILTFILFWAFSTNLAIGQSFTSVNIAEATIMEVAETEILNLQKDQTANNLETTAELGVFDKAMYEISKWRGKVNSYYQNGVGYAAELKNTTTFLHDAVNVLFSVADIIKASKDHPDGIVSTTYMSKVYFKVVAEFLDIYNVFKTQIAVGGNYNMLSGADRTQILWDLEYRMRRLNRDLQRLAICIRTYTLQDVWSSMSEPYLPRDPKRIIKNCQLKWKKASNAALENKIDPADVNLGHALNWFLGTGDNSASSHPSLVKNTDK